MKIWIVTSSFLLAVGTASAETFNCVTERIDAAPYTSFRIQMTMAGPRIAFFKAKGYVGHGFLDLKASLRPQNNPIDFLQRGPSRYARYLLEERRHDGLFEGMIEILLPEKTAPRFHGLLSYGGSQHRSLICLSVP